MIAIYANKDDINTESEMPNFVVWSWMRTGLGLCGSNLMLFAYIYSRSFDELHHTTTSLSSLSEWFGITRQTLSRNIDKLPFIIKKPSDQHPEGFYSFSYYRIDMPKLLQNFQSRSDVYQEFMASYKKLLILKFPNDKKSIDDYFEMLLDWHSGVNSKIQKETRAVVTLGNNLKNNEEISTQQTDFNTALQDIKNQLKVLSDKVDSATENTNQIAPSMESPDPGPTNIESKPKHKGAKKPHELGIVAKPQKSKPTSKEEKERIKKEKFNILINDLYSLNIDFVTIHNISDKRILNALNDYVREVVENENNPKGLTAFRYRSALEQLASVLSMDKMFTYIQNAIIGGYSKFVYDLDKVKSDNRFLVEQENVWKITSDFINHFPNAPEEFSNSINRYVEECVLSTDNWTSLGFEHRMNDLLKKNLNYEQVLQVISDTLSSGWKQWNFTNIQGNIQASNVSAIDMASKEKETEEFFRRHYFYMVPDIKTTLLDYLNQTTHGRNMTSDKWIQEMEYLLLHKHTNDDIITAIKNATLHDYEHLCTPDFAQDKRIQQTYGTLEEAVKMRDRTRQKHCEKERRNNPEDPRFEGMPIGYFDTLPSIYDDVLATNPIPG